MGVSTHCHIDDKNLDSVHDRETTWQVEASTQRLAALIHAQKHTLQAFQTEKVAHYPRLIAVTHNWAERHAHSSSRHAVSESRR
jgi:hypothetical protein